MSRAENVSYTSKAIICTAVSLLLGLIFGFWRSILLIDGDFMALAPSESGLFYPAVVMAVGILIGVAVMMRHPKPNFRLIVTSQPYKMLWLCSSMLFVAAGAIAFYDDLESLSLMTVVLTLFPIACGGAMLLRAVAKDNGDRADILSLFPVFFLCIMLLLFYRDNAYRPDSFTFAWEICTYVAVLLGCYMVCAEKFEKERPLRRNIIFMLAIAMASSQIILMIFAGTKLLEPLGLEGLYFLMMLSLLIYVSLSFIAPPRVSRNKEGSATAEK